MCSIHVPAKRSSAPPGVNVGPKKTCANEVTFRLPKPLDFDSIEWLELQLFGNVKKKVRIEPRLYANLLLRGKKPEMIFEPIKSFMRRSRDAEDGKTGGK